MAKQNSHFYLQFNADLGHCCMHKKTVIEKIAI